MALGSRVDISLHRGDDRTFTGTVKDPAGVVVDITGATMIWSVTLLAESIAPAEPPQSKSDAAALFTAKTESAGITFTDAVNGLISIALDSADTVSETAPKVYYHELQMVLSGITTTIMFGKFELVRDFIAPGP